MFQRIHICLIAGLFSLSVYAQQKAVDYVNPMIGTDGYGNVYPGAQIPFGGIQISPDTDAKFYDAAAGYKYNHTSILGFSLTHLSGTGIPDLGDFLFIPGTGEMKLDPGTRENPTEGYRSRYSHEKEWASPNYYAVELSDYGVKAEMTAGLRSGMFRFTYPKSDKAFIMIDMNYTLWQNCEWSNLRMENDSTLTGYKLVKGWGPERHVYFTAVFSKKLKNLRIMQDKKLVIYNTSRFRSCYEAWGKNLMACISFAAEEGEEVIVLMCLILIFVGGASLKQLLIIGLAGIGAALLIGFLMSDSYAYIGKRIMSWRDPFADSLGDTWQTCQSLIAIGSGGLFGLGLGESRQKYLYLPETKNDFVFSIVCEELVLFQSGRTYDHGLAE